MSNTLTGLIPVIYEALDLVARERIGFIPAVTIDANGSQAAVGQAVRSHLAPASATVNITPGSYAPDTGGQAMGYNEITITKAKSVPVQWTGEEVRSVGDQYRTMLRDQFMQAFRAIGNEVEADLAVAGVQGASRAYGTAGTTPFGTAGDLSDSAQLLKILDDNGAPTTDLHFVANNATMANFRGKQSVLFKVNEAGTADMLRKGIIGDLQGFAIHQSGQLALHTAGTGSGYLYNGSSAAVGDLTIPADVGSGTILAGDFVTAAGDTNKYVVGTALSAGSFAINKPGLKAVIADDVALTVGASYTPNLAFHRSALVLLARQPIMPPGGDAAVDVMDVVDPVSGLVFQIALYRGYRQIHIEIGLAWGVKAFKPEFISTLLG